MTTDAPTREESPVAWHVRLLGPSSIPFDLVWELVRIAEVKQSQPCNKSCCGTVCEAFKLTEAVKDRIKEAKLWREPAS